MSNREIEVQRQLDAARQQIQRLREAAQRIIDDHTWDDVNKDAEAWVSSQYLYADIVILRDALAEMDQNPNPKIRFSEAAAALRKAIVDAESQP